MKSDINKHVAQLNFIFITGFISCMPRNCKGYTKKVASNQVLALHSLRGKKGKKPFQDHLMYRVVLREWNVHVIV